MNVLLDYVFNVSTITPTPAASTSFLKKVLAVVKPKNGVTPGTITLCTSKSAVAALTNNADVDKLFDAGLSSVFVLPSDDLDLAAAIEGKETDFYTVLISSDFTDEETIDSTPAVAASVKVQDILFTAVEAGVAGNDINVKYEDALSKDDGSATVTVTEGAIVVDIEDGVTTAATIYAALIAESDVTDIVTPLLDAGDESDAQAAFTPHVHLAGGLDAVEGTIDLGTFSGVVGIYSDDKSVCAVHAATEKRCGFYSLTATKAKNMFYAFGKMLANALNWNNQQYITVTNNDSVNTLGDANALFDDKVSFAINDEQYGNRLALFACGGKAIVAPYIIRNLEIDLQSKALSYISGNQPQYTKKQATLLENALKDVIQLYIDRQWIDAGVIDIKLENENFIASGYINVAEPKAMWRVFAEMRQTL